MPSKERRPPSEDGSKFETHVFTELDRPVLAHCFWDDEDDPASVTAVLFSHARQAKKYAERLPHEQRDAVLALAGELQDAAKDTRLVEIRGRDAVTVTALINLYHKAKTVRIERPDIVNFANPINPCDGAFVSWFGPDKKFYFVIAKSTAQLKATVDALTWLPPASWEHYQRMVPFMGLPPSSKERRVYCDGPIAELFAKAGVLWKTEIMPLVKREVLH